MFPKEVIPSLLELSKLEVEPFKKYITYKMHLLQEADLPQTQEDCLKFLEVNLERLAVHSGELKEILGITESEYRKLLEQEVLIPSHHLSWLKYDRVLEVPQYSILALGKIKADLEGYQATWEADLAVTPEKPRKKVRGGAFVEIKIQVEGLPELEQEGFALCFWTQLASRWITEFQLKNERALSKKTQAAALEQAEFFYDLKNKALARIAQQGQSTLSFYVPENPHHAIHGKHHYSLYYLNWNSSSPISFGFHTSYPIGQSFFGPALDLPRVEHGEDEGEFRFGRPRDQEEKLSYSAKTVQQQLEKLLEGFEMPVFEVKDEALEPGYPTGIKIKLEGGHGVLDQYLPHYWFEQIKPYLHRRLESEVAGDPWGSSFLAQIIPRQHIETVAQILGITLPGTLLDALQSGAKAESTKAKPADQLKPQIVLRNGQFVFNRLLTPEQYQQIRLNVELQGRQIEGRDFEGLRVVIPARNLAKVAELLKIKPAQDIRWMARNPNQPKPGERQNVKKLRIIFSSGQFTFNHLLPKSQFKRIKPFLKMPEVPTREENELAHLQGYKAIIPRKNLKKVAKMLEITLSQEVEASYRRTKPKRKVKNPL